MVFKFPIRKLQIPQITFLSKIKQNFSKILIRYKVENFEKLKKISVWTVFSCVGTDLSQQFLLIHFKYVNIINFHMYRNHWFSTIVSNFWKFVFDPVTGVYQKAEVFSSENTYQRQCIKGKTFMSNSSKLSPN